MDNLKQAYEILGLPENASKEDVEKRYMILMRQARVQERSEDVPEAERIDFNAVNRAYKQILKYEDHQKLEELTQEKYGKYKKYAGVAEKTDHFFHYYRYHLIIGLAVIVLIGFGIKGFLDNQAEKARLAQLPPPDVTVMLHGEFYMDDGGQDYERLEEALLGEFPEWQRVIASITYVPTETRSEHDIASLQKSILNLMTEKRDVYLLDRSSFESLSKQGVLQPIDDAVQDQLAGIIPEGAALTSKTEEDTEEHIYGINVTDSPFLKRLPILHKEVIVGIRFDAVNRDNGILLIKRMLQD
ncbi:J domain-containing protein [Paenibacillus tarimensis]